MGWGLQGAEEGGGGQLKTETWAQAELTLHDSSGALSFSVSLSDVFAPSGGRMTSQRAVEKVALW